jgi:hypothetical protein
MGINLAIPHIKSFICTPGFAAEQNHQVSIA